MVSFVARARPLLVLLLASVLTAVGFFLTRSVYFPAASAAQQYPNPLLLEITPGVTAVLAAIYLKTSVPTLERQAARGLAGPRVLAYALGLVIAAGPVALLHELAHLQPAPPEAAIECAALLGLTVLLESATSNQGAWLLTLVYTVMSLYLGQVAEPPVADLLIAAPHPTLVQTVIAGGLALAGAAHHLLRQARVTDRQVNS